MFEYVVLSDSLDGKAKNAGQEQAVAHTIFHERRRGFVDREIAMQVVHALAQNPPDHFLIEDEDLCQQLVALKFVEGLEKPFVAV